MVVPLELDPGRHDPQSPFYEPTEAERRRQEERERQARMEEARMEQWERERELLEEARAVAGPE